MRIPYDHVKDSIPTEMGKQVRINHTACPAGRDTRARLYIKRTASVVLCYCHNCEGSLVLSKARTMLPPQEMRAVLEKMEKEHATSTEVVLPDDTKEDVTAWPDEARAWFYQYELDDTDIARYRIGWSDSLQRIILPVYEEGKLVWWQGRSLTSPQKYYNITTAKKPVFITKPAITVKRGVCVVEDMVSAIKLAKTGKVHGCVLFGTHAPDELAELLRPFPKGWVWLDRDEAGRKKEQDIRQQLSLLLSWGIGPSPVGCPTCPKDTSLDKMSSWGW